MEDDPLIGREIDGRYAVESLLGEGGMGVVYRARHLLMETTVALKVIHPALATTPEVRQRFLREARTATSISHPRVVTVRDVGQIDNQLYLTMDLVKGTPLQEVLESDGPLPTSRALGIIDQVLQALEAAHAKGIVHRDLKPGNVMLEDFDAVKVLDFGLAKWIGPAISGDKESLTISGHIVGTLGYMAPEQVTGDPVDERTDLYAVAVLLYEMLTGKRPHDATSGTSLLRQIVLEDPEPLPGPVGEVVMCGLAREADKRPGSAAEFRRLLDRAAEEVSAEPATKHKPGRASTYAWAALILAVIAGTAFFGLRTSDRDRLGAHLSAARAALQEERWADAASAFEQAAAIERTTETILGLERARLGIHRKAAMDAESAADWTTALTAWQEAAKYADSNSMPDDQIERARFEVDVTRVALALDGDDEDEAARLLANRDVSTMVAERRERWTALEDRLHAQITARLLNEAEAAIAGEAPENAAALLVELEPRIGTQAERERFEHLRSKLGEWERKQAQALNEATRALRSDLSAVDLRIGGAQAILDASKDRKVAELPAEEASLRESALLTKRTLLAVRVLIHSEILRDGSLETLEQRTSSAARRLLEHRSDPAREDVLAMLKEVRAHRARLGALEAEVRVAFAHDGNGRTPLHTAAERGEERVAARLLQFGVDPSPADPDGVTPLHLAARFGRIAVIDRLLAAGADREAAAKTWQVPGDKPGDRRDITLESATALHVAAAFGQQAAANLLLERGAEPNATAYLQMPRALYADAVQPIHIAARKGHAALIRGLLAAGADPKAPYSRRAATPLHLAAAAGSGEAIKALLDAGVAVDVRCGYQMTPLFDAAMSGDLDSVQRLLAAKANASAKTLSDDSAIQDASTIAIAKALAKAGADPHHRGKNGRTLLVVAAFSGGIDLVRWLLDEGHSVEQEAVGLGNVITAAAQSARDGASARPLLELLAARGGDLKKAESRGRRATAIHVASATWDLDAVRFLVERGLSATAPDGSGQTPLHYWARSAGGAPLGADRGKALFEFLREKGATVDAKGGFYERTPLHLAGTGQAARLLVAAGAKVSRPDSQQSTPLHQAAREGRLEVVRVLLESGADPNAWSPAWGTAFRGASGAHENAVDIMKLLLARGAVVDTAEEARALTRAVQAHNIDSLRFLKARRVSFTRTRAGATLLHAWAGGWNNYPRRTPATFKFLLEQGLSISAKNDHGDTPLHTVARGNLDEGSLRVRILVEAGAAVNARNKEGKTPLALASALHAQHPDSTDTSRRVVEYLRSVGGR